MADESTSSDPAPALELLWRPPASPRRGPKPRLDLADIVRSAMEVADHDGLAAVSMRRVGTELGVGTATLYTYVPGRNELLALLLDTVAGFSTLPHNFPGNWRSQFESWAREDWQILVRHPWAVELDSGRVVPGPNGLAWYDSALSVLSDTRMSEPEKVASIQALDSYVRGSVWSAVASPTWSEEAEAVDGRTWLARRDATLRELVDFTRYPAMLRAVAAGTEPESSQNFELGLSLILDGIGALIERRESDPADHVDR